MTRRGAVIGAASLVIVGSVVGLGSTSVTAATKNAIPLPPIVSGLKGLLTGTTTTTVPKAVAPLAPTSVTAVQNGAAPDLKATWKYSTAGTAATGAVVQLYSVTNAQDAGAIFQGQIVCGNACTSTIFRELTFGTLYAFLVYPTNAVGTGAPTGSAALAPTTACTVGACVSLNATAPIGAANHAASGLLVSLFPLGNDQVDTAALKTTMWRGSPGYNADGTLNWSSWNVATADAVPTTMVLSNLWSGAHGGNPPTPWSNWTAYTTWVKSTVTAVVASKEAVNYWEVYNEPGGAGYYSAANYATVTPALLLQQFLVTYQAIKAVAPTAAIIGPSLEHWADYPNEYAAKGGTSQEFDMVTFLNFAVTNNLQLAAISWHEIDDTGGPNPSENTLAPSTLEDHVAEARSLIAARPSLGNPQIFINEYALPEVQLIPGWDVGYLAALTTAGVNSASRACWSNNCMSPTLDGLLGSDGVTPQNSYWDRMIYASMSGNMVTTTSTSDFVSALGSYDSTTGAVTGLIGRGVGCNQESWCTTTWPSSTLAAPTAVTVTVTVPWSSGTAKISLTDVPGQTIGNTPAPAPVLSTAPIAPTGSGTGTITVTIPAFADGDAYGLSITH
ncbi:MAG TPA: hypothetical protein VG298_07525 [Acidimicrobiales bacterium]|nr:hypothetical protein [Acidimicrobiales bacterium]